MFREKQKACQKENISHPVGQEGTMSLKVTQQNSVRALHCSLGTLGNQIWDCGVSFWGFIQCHLGACP